MNAEKLNQVHKRKAIYEQKYGIDIKEISHET